MSGKGMSGRGRTILGSSWVYGRLKKLREDPSKKDTRLPVSFPQGCGSTSACHVLYFLVFTPSARIIYFYTNKYGHLEARKKEATGWQPGSQETEPQTVVRRHLYTLLPTDSIWVLFFPSHSLSFVFFRSPTTPLMLYTSPRLPELSLALWETRVCNHRLPLAEMDYRLLQREGPELGGPGSGFAAAFRDHLQGPGLATKPHDSTKKSTATP